MKDCAARRGQLFVSFCVTWKRHALGKFLGTDEVVLSGGSSIVTKKRSTSIQLML